MYAFILFVIVAFTINAGYCIKCYDCDSTKDNKCLDPFIKKDFVQTECSEAIVAQISNILSKIPFFKNMVSTNEFLCVKLNVTTLGENGLLRSCVAKPTKSTYCEFALEQGKKWFGSLNKVHYCGTCKRDGCNGVGKVKGIWLAIIVAGLVCVFPKLLLNLW
uniref:Uncharacterized protein n=1 Tax=Rhodnius prolixus TaxID=13249 RepID=T1IFT4_RHOPR